MKKVIFIFLIFGALFLGTYAQSYWNLTGNGGTTSSNFIGTTDDNPLIFRTRSFERMQLHSEKAFLGIGVSYPQATLHLHYQQGANPTQKLLQLTTDATGNTSTNGFCIFSDANTKDILMKQQEGSKFSIEGPGGGLVIAPTGKIGFGTAAPTEKVHVAGKLLIDRTANTPSSLQFKHPGTSLVNPGDGDIRTISTYYWDIYSDVSGLKFNTVMMNNGVPALTQQMVFGRNGRVGIGVANPLAKLDVGGAFKAQSATITEALTVNTLSAQTATVTGNTYLNGNVGIGTTNPQAKLEVAGTFKAQSATLTGSLNAQSATLTGALNAQRATLTNSLNAQSANISGNFTTKYLYTTNAQIDSTLTARDAYFENTGINGYFTAKKARIDGTLCTKKVSVEASPCYPDFVFEKDYHLLPLSEVEQYIKQYRHLPEIPSAQNANENGLDLGDMQEKLLQKIEELTLYIIEQEKQMKKLENRLSELETKKGGE